MVWRRGLSKARIIKLTCLTDRVKRFKAGCAGTSSAEIYEGCKLKYELMQYSIEA